MGLLNYTTTIDAWTTISQIQQLLAKAGASHFSIKNEGSKPAAVTFTIDHNGQPLNFLLPCNVEGIKRQLVKSDLNWKRGKQINIDDHALNVGWRIVKDWIEAQSALIAVNMATIEEVFMPYLIVNAQGETLSQKILKGDGMKLLNF